MSISSNPYLLVLPQLMSAKKKIGTVAAFFDPSKISLAGFDSVCLDATQFREQLRRNMGVNVTDEELGALVYLFDKNGDGFIDTVEFKNEFFRLGKLERDKHTARKSDEKIAYARRMKVTEDRQKAYLARFSKTNVADSWTEEQQKSAIQKIAHIAFTYDGFKGGLESFAYAKSIKPAEFKEILRRKFETYLTPEETGALVDIFDRDQNGMVDTREFMYQFFRIGREEKEYHHNKQHKLTVENQVAEKTRLKEMKERFGKLVEARMEPHTKEDYDSAVGKITRAALYFKGDSAFSGNLWKSFESSDLNPTEFKELLKQNFDIYLTPGELDAMVCLFDTDQNGDVSCVEFMTTFFRIALKERSQILTAKKEKERQFALKTAERVQARVHRQKMMTLTSVVWPDIPVEENDSTILVFDGDLSLQELAGTIGVGAGEVIKYIADHHQVYKDGNDMLTAKLAREVARHHGCTVKDAEDAEKKKANQRSVAPMLPTGKKGSRNEFLQKKPSLQSAIAAHKMKKVGKKQGGSQSMADMYPSASRDCKDFIRSLEMSERELRTQKTSKKKRGSGSKKKSSGLDAFASSVGGGNGNNQNKQNYHEDNNAGTLDNWSFADEGNPKAAMNSSMYASEDFDSRPGTSANSDRGASQGSSSRGGRRPPQQGGGGMDTHDTSIAEEY